MSAPAQGPARTLLPHALLVVAALCWAGNFAVGRALHDAVPPLTLNLWRWIVALALLAPFTARALLRARHTLRAHWRLLLALALTGVTAFQSFVYLALQTTGAINGALFLSVTPVVIVALSWLLFGERLRARQALGIAVSLAGAATLIARGDPGALLELRFDRGDLWMLGAPPAWALYSVLLRRRPPELAPLPLLAVTAALGLALQAPLALAEAAAGARWTLTPATLGGILYVGVFASVVAFLCWNRGVAGVGANRAGLFLHLIPVFSALLAVGLLGESLRPFHGVGAGLILAGIGLVATRRAAAS